jgi:hypothetical protein
LMLLNFVGINLLKEFQVVIFFSAFIFSFVDLVSLIWLSFV